MATMNISLPDSLKKYVQQRCTKADFSNPSDYVRALIRADKKRQAQERLEHMLLDGFNSVEPIEITEEYWDNKKKELLARHRKTNRS